MDVNDPDALKKFKTRKSRLLKRKNRKALNLRRRKEAKIANYPRELTQTY